MTPPFQFFCLNCQRSWTDLVACYLFSACVKVFHLFKKSTFGSFAPWPAVQLFSCQINLWSLQCHPSHWAPDGKTQAGLLLIFTRRIITQSNACKRKEEQFGWIEYVYSWTWYCNYHTHLSNRVDSKNISETMLWSCNTASESLDYNITWSWNPGCWDDVSTKSEAIFIWAALGPFSES